MDDAELRQAEAAYAEETAQLKKYKGAQSLLILGFLAAELGLGLCSDTLFCVAMVATCVCCLLFLHPSLPDKAAASTSAGAKAAFVMLCLGMGITLAAQILALTAFPLWICLLVYVPVLYIGKKCASLYLKKQEPGISAGKLKKKQYEDKKKQYEDKKQQQKWKKEAAEGKAEAQFELALMYERGNGVTKDVAEAAKWYRAAAEQGFAKAQTNLGICYRNGEGVTRDYAEALKWYKKAAEQGRAVARTHIGDMYRLGLGVETDLNEAAQWYKKAAEQGNAWGQYELGKMFRDGWYRGGHKIQSFAEAVKWMTKAAEQGNPQMQYALGRLYDLRDVNIYEPGPLRDELLESYGERYEYKVEDKVRKLAPKWFRRAAEQGMADAQHMYALCLEFGDGISTDYAEAAMWAKKAADQGHVEAMSTLGRNYVAHLGKTNEGLVWLLKAARLGDIDASEELAEYYEKGSYGVEKDLMKAADFKNLAEAQRLVQGR